VVSDTPRCASNPQQAVTDPRFARSGDDGVGMEAGGMPDAVPPVDLASLAAGWDHPGARWRLDGEALQANLVRLNEGDRIQPHRNDEILALTDPEQGPDLTPIFSKLGTGHAPA
jgi:hypothetical protein